MDKHYHYRTCGLDNVYLMNGFKRTKTGYGDAVSIHDIDGLHQAIGMSLVNKNAQLTGKEFRFLRHEMNLSQKAMGVWFDCTDQAVANWEKKDAVPMWADILVRAIYIETLGSESKVRSLVKKLSEIDRDYHYAKLCLESTDTGWVNAA